MGLFHILPLSTHLLSGHWLQSFPDDIIQSQQLPKLPQAQDGPAAASSDRAKRAMEAVEKGPTNSTNPDKDDDHSGFGATDVGPGSNRDDPKATEGTSSLMGASGMKGSWLTQLVGMCFC